MTVMTLDRSTLDALSPTSPGGLERCLGVAAEEELGADRDVGGHPASNVRLYCPASAVTVDMRTVSETRIISASCSGPSPPGIIAMYRILTCASRLLRFLRSTARHISTGSAYISALKGPQRRIRWRERAVPSPEEKFSPSVSAASVYAFRIWGPDMLSEVLRPQLPLPDNFPFA